MLPSKGLHPFSLTMSDATLDSSKKKKKKKFDSSAASSKESDERGSRYMMLSEEEEDDLVKDNKKSKESVEEEEEEEEEEEYEYVIPVSVNRYLALASNHQHVELNRRRILEKKEMNADIQRKQDKRKGTTFTLYLQRFLECPKLPWCEDWRTCSPNDPYILKTKKLLIEKRSSLKLKQIGSHELQVDASLSNKTPRALLESIVRAARIFHLNREELYFVGEKDYGPFSPINELESLNSIRISLECLISSGKSDGKEVLQLLEKEIRDMIISYVDDISVQYPDGDPENASMTPYMQSAGARDLDKLLELGLAKPTDTKLWITNVSEGKGLVASEEIDIGDTVLEIPKSRIISEDVVLQSKMFKDLKDMERFNIDPEEKFLLWIMKEKNNLNSEFQYYFQNLPQFKTGLSFGDDALAALEGTGLQEKILMNKELLKSRHKILLPIIQKANLPSSFGDFLWAWELLHSCGMHIFFPDGKWKTCLVPVAGFFNHSLCPHVLHCDLGTDSLKFVASRPCRKGQQCYMSYGKFSRSYLITFYGFLPKDHNYHDVLPLDNWLCDDEYYFDYVPGSEWNKPMIREIMSVKSPNFGLPQPLLKLLHKVYANTVPPETNAQSQVERVKYEILYHRVDDRLDALDIYHEHWKKKRSKDLELSWDLQLALDYRQSFIRILTTVRRSCLLALRPWKMDVFYFVLGAERYFQAMEEAETFFQKCSI